MTFKTILMHCNDHRRLKSLLAPTLTIASKFESHVIGLSVVPPVAVVASGAFEAQPIIIDEHCEIYRQSVPGMHRQFEETMAPAAVTRVWRDVEAGPMGVADVVLSHGHAADLIIASQPDPDWASGEWLDVPDRLAVESGRPVLVIPNGRPSAEVGTRILVAWDGRREAARAVFDALPLLQQATSVNVVQITDGEQALAPDITPALIRHGAKAEPTKYIKSLTGAGPALMDQVDALDADLLVMGCYGHSRLREFVLGGATRHLLQKMRIPVLMSH